MAAWLKQPIGPGRNVDGKQSNEIPDSVREAAGQTQIVGAPMVVTAGTAAQCASDPTAVTGFAFTAGRNLAAADVNPNLQVLPVRVGKRFIACLKEAQSTVETGTSVGLLKEGTDWVFSTTCTNKKFTIRRKSVIAASADTYVPTEVEYTG